MKRLIMLPLLLGLVFVMVTAHAVPTYYGFKAITSNSVIDPDIGEAQLSLSVDSYGTNQVLFNFSNSGLSACSITAIYIEDGILSLYDILDGGGVSFSLTDKNNPELPSGNNIGFVADKYLTVDSDAPTQPNGVNPGEQVGLVFNLLDSNTYDELVNRLNLGLTKTSSTPGNGDGDIRIGIHVQGFADGQSESFVLTPPPAVVPVPGTAGLGGIGIAFVGWLRRRRTL